MRRRDGQTVLVGGWESSAFTWWDDARDFALIRARRTGIRQQVKRRHGFWQVISR